MKTLRVATTATLFLALTLPLLHVSASADVPPPGPPGLIDPDLLPEGDDFPSPFELGARLVGKSPECAEKCRHLIFEYGKALKRFEEAEDASHQEERALPEEQRIEVQGGVQEIVRIRIALRERQCAVENRGLIRIEDRRQSVTQGEQSQRECQQTHHAEADRLTIHSHRFGR